MHKKWVGKQNMLTLAIMQSKVEILSDSHVIIVNATNFFPIFLQFQNKFVSLFRDLRMADDYRDDNNQAKWRKSQNIEGKTTSFIIRYSRTSN